MADGLRRLLKTGRCEMEKEEVNKVVYERDEVKMISIRNRKKEEKKQEES